MGPRMSETPSCATTEPSTYYHRVHDRLRVHDDVDAARLDVEEPARLDHLEALVHERRRVDGDLVAHRPVGVLQGAGRRHRGQLPGRDGPERTAGRGEEEPPDVGVVVPDERLEDGAVLRVDGEDGDALRG